MHLATAVDRSGVTRAVIIEARRGAIGVDELLAGEFPDALAVLRELTPSDLRSKVAGLPAAAFLPLEQITITAPYRHPRMIWGIGLNYREHASDLSETAPHEEPASFIKADHTVIGPGEPIPLPVQSTRVTAEAELGLVIGRECRNISEEEALDHVWGVVPVLDQTAEDILARNPRFLTRSKNFPGFFSFGPQIVPMDEVLEAFGTIDRVAVETVRNGEVHRGDEVANMMFGPARLISFHSHVMPLMPGDILSTGTPGAVQVHAGDTAECRIDGVGVLRNPVIAAAAAG